MSDFGGMESISVIRSDGSHPLTNVASEKENSRSEVVSRRRARIVLTATTYGILTLLVALLGLGLFLFFAYHAFGGMGILIAASVIVSGVFFLTKFVLLYPG